MDNCPSILKKNLRGMSLTEILIVVSILSIIAVVLISAFQPGTQLGKARDARRKSDLAKLKIKLEDYYNDNKKYPDTLICGQSLAPYMDKIPCDPGTGSSYPYVKSSNSYQIYTTLNNLSDAQIAQVGCENGCGPGNNCLYNYGISSPNISLDNCDDCDYGCYGDNPTCHVGMASHDCPRRFCDVAQCTAVCSSGSGKSLVCK